MVRINGQNVAIDTITVTEYLEKNGYSLDRIVVELNGAILPKINYSETVLKANDIVEIVSFVAGG